MKLYHQIVLESTTAYYVPLLLIQVQTLSPDLVTTNPSESAHVSALFTYSTQGRKRGKTPTAVFTTRFFISVLCLPIHHAARQLISLTHRGRRTDSGRTSHQAAFAAPLVTFSKTCKIQERQRRLCSRATNIFSENSPVTPTDNNQLEVRRQDIISHYRKICDTLEQRHKFCQMQNCFVNQQYIPLILMLYLETGSRKRHLLNDGRLIQLSVRSFYCKGFLGFFCLGFLTEIPTINFSEVIWCSSECSCTTNNFNIIERIFLSYFFSVLTSPSHMIKEQTPPLYLQRSNPQRF